MGEDDEEIISMMGSEEPEMLDEAEKKEVNSQLRQLVLVNLRKFK